MASSHKSKKRAARVAIDDVAPGIEFPAFEMMATLDAYLQKFLNHPPPKLQLLEHTLLEPTQQYLDVVREAIKTVEFTNLSDRVGEEKALRKVEILDDKLNQEPTIGHLRRKHRSPLETYDDIRQRRQIARHAYHPHARKSS